MSTLHVCQIKANLEKAFRPVIDLSDVANLSEAEKEKRFLTRSLAAFSVAYLAQIDPSEAAKAVTDGWKDNGLDAIYYHPTERILYLVQSKWRQDGTGSLDRAEILKFLTGFRDLLNARWDRFNHKVSIRSNELDAVLDDASTRIMLLIVYTGQDALSQVIWQDINDIMKEINEPTEMVSVQVLRQTNLYGAVAQGLEGAPIDLDVALFDWGQVREPYIGFYGQVSASDIAEWFSIHQTRLLSPNIRMFLGATEVNDTIVHTLLTSPHDFWYFNNGITVLSRTIRKKPIGGQTRETGYFACHDLRVVNGAQTVGAITQAAGKDPDSVAKARVGIRLISLEHCPPEFDKKVTRYTNTQNRIDRRDFVALDVEQERIRGELKLEGISYIYKSGETQPPTVTGFDLNEATIARACMQTEVGVAVQAKREIGRLWDDIEKAPYKILFNSGVSGPSLWRAVQITRVVESTLGCLRLKNKGRERLLAVHGNRFLSHLVFSQLPKELIDSSDTINNNKKEIKELTQCLFSKASMSLNANYTDAYLGSLFKKRLIPLLPVPSAYRRSSVIGERKTPAISRNS